MGSSFVLTGDDTIIINAIPLNDLADGNIGNIEFANDIFNPQTGKNGNTIFALDESGNNATLTVRSLMNGTSDKRLNGLIPKSGSFASTVLLTGALVKQVGDGQGNVSYNTYTLAGGMIRRKPNASSNVNGETEQGVVEYTIFFANGARSIA